MPNDERYEQKTDKLGYDAKRLLQTAAVLLEELIPDNVGFALFLVPKGENSAEQGGGVAYIANVERQGLSDAIQFWIDESKRRGIIK